MRITINRKFLICCHTKQIARFLVSEHISKWLVQYVFVSKCHHCWRLFSEAYHLKTYFTWRPCCAVSRTKNSSLSNVNKMSLRCSADLNRSAHFIEHRSMVPKRVDWNWNDPILPISVPKNYVEAICRLKCSLKLGYYNVARFWSGSQIS